MCLFRPALVQICLSWSVAVASSGVTVPPPSSPVGSLSSSSPEALGTQRKMRCHGFTIGPLTGAGALQSAAQVENACLSLLRPLRQQESSNSSLTPLAPPPPSLVVFSLALTAANSSALTSLPVHLHRGGAWSLFQSGPTCLC